MPKGSTPEQRSCAECVKKYEPCSELLLLSQSSWLTGPHLSLTERICEDPVALYIREDEATLGELFMRARDGDSRAARTLFEIAKSSCWFLEWLSQYRPESVIPFARERHTWPVNLGLRRKLQAEAISVLKKVKLGAGIKLSAGWQGHTIANKQALEMLTWLELNQHHLGLPDRTLDNRLKWFEAGWNAILFLTNGDPTSDPFLHKLGASAARKKPKFCKELNPATSASNARSKIKELLRRAFLISTTDFFPRSGSSLG
jgi:hypothetical protein